VAETQAAANHWEDSATGGVLNSEKSFWYRLVWNGSTGRPQEEPMPGNIKVHDDAGRPITSNGFEADVTLGSELGPDGNMKERSSTYWIRQGLHRHHPHLQEGLQE
jgi:hypothetical protein